MTDPYAAAPPHLTPAECRVIELMAQGADTHDIATTLSIQPHSVYQYIYTIKWKLGYRSREQIIAWYHRQRAA